MSQRHDVGNAGDGYRSVDRGNNTKRFNSTTADYKSVETGSFKTSRDKLPIPSCNIQSTINHFQNIAKQRQKQNEEHKTGNLSDRRPSDYVTNIRPQSGYCTPRSYKPQSGYATPRSNEIKPQGACSTPRTNENIRSQGGYSKSSSYENVKSQVSYSSPRTYENIRPQGGHSTPRSNEPIRLQGGYSTPRSSEPIRLQGGYCTPRSNDAIKPQGGCSTPRSNETIKSQGACSTPRSYANIRTQSACSTPRSNEIQTQGGYSTPRSNETIKPQGAFSLPRSYENIRLQGGFSTPRSSEIKPQGACSTPRSSEIKPQGACSTPRSNECIGPQVACSTPRSNESKPQGGHSTPRSYENIRPQGGFSTPRSSEIKPQGGGYSTPRSYEKIGNSWTATEKPAIPACSYQSNDNREQEVTSKLRSTSHVQMLSRMFEENVARNSGSNTGYIPTPNKSFQGETYRKREHPIEPKSPRPYSTSSDRSTIQAPISSKAWCREKNPEKGSVSSGSTQSYATNKPKVFGSLREELLYKLECFKEKRNIPENKAAKTNAGAAEQASNLKDTKNQSKTVPEPARQPSAKYPNNAIGEMRRRFSTETPSSDNSTFYGARKYRSHSTILSSSNAAVSEGVQRGYRTTSLSKNTWEPRNRSNQFTPLPTYINDTLLKPAPSPPPPLFICLNPKACISLRSILDCFKSPISEEHAWALIFQFATLYHKLSTVDKNHIFNITQIPQTIDNINIHRDGCVHCSWTPMELKERKKEQEKSDRETRGVNHFILLVASHRRVLRNLAVIVYNALDYNLQNDEQCKISDELEQLIDYMTADFENQILDKDNECREFPFVVKVCSNRLKPNVRADIHYKGVCRGLVTETLELRTFLEQVLGKEGSEAHMRSGSAENAEKSQQELADLGFSDWARFWVQVIDEMRQGYKLKPTEPAPKHVEFKLTPYEILMEDIRSKNYILKKVMVNGETPARVRSDSHSVIMDYIKSRPPLKKASERVLAPPVKRELSPREQLMEAIRQGTKLRHVEVPDKNKLLKERLYPLAEAIEPETETETETDTETETETVETVTTVHITNAMPRSSCDVNGRRDSCTNTAKG